MGNSVPYDPRRGYARPGEIDLPIPKPKSAEPRLDVPPVPNHLSSTRPGEIAPPILKARSAEPWPDVPPVANRLSSAPTGETAPPIPKPKSAELWPDIAQVPIRLSSTPPSGKDKINRINTVNTANTTNPVNRNKVSARFELLPDRKPQWGRIGVSAAAQLTALGLLLLAPLIFSQPMQTALKFDVVELMQPVTQIELPSKTPPPPPKVKPKVRPPEPKPVVEPEPVVLSPKQPHVFLVTKPEPPKVRTLEAKPLEINPTLKETRIVVEILPPVAPKEEVKVAPNPGNP